MDKTTIRRALLVFHWTLGVVVAIQSAGALINFLSVKAEGANLPGVAVLASVETLAAVFFLVPRFVRASGWTLIVIFFIAFVLHFHAGELQLPLLIYASGVFVVVSSSESLNKRRQSTAAD